MSWLTLAAVLPVLAAESPSYGADFSLSYGMGALLNRWPESNVHGFGGLRFDFFPTPLDVPGPRVGGSIWARGSAWPGPTATETVGGTVNQFDIRWQQYGMHLAIRSDALRAWGGTFGFGFSRMDIEDYYDGVIALPLMSLEGGLRRELGRGFVDLYAAGGWATARNETGGWEEWWTLSGNLAAGVHLR